MKVTQVRLNAAAKINLTLDITGVRQDGYHLLESVMQTISIYDTIDIKATDSGKIDLKINVPFIPFDSRNTCYKAVQAFFEASGKEISGVEICIHKSIPSSAGLGGGSADAAAVLRGLEYIYGKCPVNLYDLAAGIGADVPFCLAGGTKLCSGIGEIMSPVYTAPYKSNSIHLVVAKNARGLSTPQIFSLYDSFDRTKLIHPDSNKLISALERGNPEEIAQNIGNVLEQVSVTKRPEIADLIQAIKNHGALNAIMTGSGAAVFGIFDNYKKARQCVFSLCQKGVYAEYANFVSTPTVQ
ncbi:MAG: 4-(cytidine 5'-diphospho)-2-C-methyl-D-erythritol kinase [Clostridia bacterium]|nr:4-(cytidine 5'-diphospho)-2-C-methyl-D-erythritol kinase [Clostridia bacterium]